MKNSIFLFFNKKFRRWVVFDNFLIAEDWIFFIIFFIYFYIFSCTNNNNNLIIIVFQSKLFYDVKNMLNNEEK